MNAPARTVCGSRTLAVGERIREYLGEHPELTHRPKQIAEALGVSLGSAKREAKAYRDSQTPARLGPIMFQSVRFFSRTAPGTTYPGSPPLGWHNRGDNKLTRTVSLPPDGRMNVCWDPNGTAEVTMAATRGLTSSEVLQALSFAGNVLPLDRDFMGKLSYEALRDGGSLLLEGVKGVTLRTWESILIKVYQHSDKRGELLRTEVRAPPAKVTLREVQEMLLDRRLLGRDSAIERLSLQVEENTKAALWARRVILQMRKAVDQLRGSG